ncbi:MAG: chemotaxis protein CheW [Bdellovibrionales bacterium]|nr:chemotaxis protein CheW [Bdellovibrionales bacterium]
MEQELLHEFIVESIESLDKLDSQFVLLEENPNDTDLLNSIFRTVHTIKGTCGFLELSKLESITHVGENLLDSLRAGRRAVDSEITTALLDLIDAIRRILAQLSATESEGPEAYTELVARLQNLNDIPRASANETSASTVTLDESSSELELQEYLRAQEALRRVEAEKCEAEETISDTSSPLPIPPTEEKEDESRSSPPTDEASKSATSSPSDLSLRVDVTLIDSLLNLVSELVLARNQILQSAKLIGDEALSHSTQRLDNITSQLQEGIMKTRMQPVRNVWNKLPRVVRDVAKSCGKEVRLEMSGEGTELDKTVIEAIKDPLTHIIRNSVDHGIELPAVRESAGKNRVGVVHLKAGHEGGVVIIEIEDDGGGLNTDRIREKALERNIITETQALQMNDSDVNRLIFAPGFSTAEKVTNISGRGVGMDVVRSNIEAIGGSVDVMSTRGKGSTVRIKIPLTLAIVPALLIEAHSHVFAIPQNTLQELLRLKSTDLAKGLQVVGGNPYYDLRGELLPLLSLSAILQNKQTVVEVDENTVLMIAVVQEERGQFGLIIDRVLDNEEIVVKPLARQLKSLQFFSGATILGDGSVSLILDVHGIGNVIFSAHLGRRTAQRLRDEEEAQNDIQELVLVGVGENRIAALPLSAVSRLEEFTTDQLEQAGEDIVVQYRGTLLPLVDVPQIFGIQREYTGTIPVVVISNEDALVGLVVEKVVDIVSERLSVERHQEMPGVYGATVIKGRVTELLDSSAFFPQ